MKRSLRACLCIFLSLYFSSELSAQVTANFTSNIVTGCSPILVHFTDLSTGNPTSWQWNLGNGTTSTLQNPSTTYILPGTYTVSLTVSNGSSSNTHTVNGYIVVTPPPSVNFIADDSTVSCPPKTVQFTDLSVPGAGGTTNYVWDFGDGNSSTLQNPSNTYTNVGNYSVSLIVTNSNGCSEVLTKNQYIQVVQKPTAAFSSFNSNTCTVPATVNFVNNSSGAISYDWAFGDGTTGTATNPSHSYNTPGSYTVRLIATNASGCKDTIIKTAFVNVGNLDAAFTTSNTTTCTDNMVSFTNTSTPGPGNSVWHFGDGTTANTPNATHVYANAGTYIVKLVVSYNNCSDSATQTIIVNQGPTSQFTATPQFGCSVPFTTQFNNNSTGATSYLWIFGDGTTSTQTTPSKTYTSMGVYTVKLVAYSANGCIDTFTRNNYIKVTNPTANITYSPTSACSPVTLQFSSNIVTNIPVSSYSWSFGSGPGSTAANPSHTYNSPGNYTVSLTYTTGTGCSFTTQTTVVVGTKPNASFTATPNLVCPLQTVNFNNTTTGATAYQWTFSPLGNSTLTNPTYAFTSSGTYTVVLIATNNGCSDTAQQVVTVQPPNASFTKTYSCTNRKQVTFNNISLNANTNNWNFGDGTTSTVVSPTHTYVNYGQYIVTLVVYNSATGCTSTVQHPVQVFPIDAQFTANDTTICKGENVNFTAQPDSNLVTYKWTYGDGVTQTTGSNIANHIYPTPGIYTVRLIVKDTHQCSDTLQRNSYIKVGGPVTDFIGTPTNGCAPLPVNFTDQTVSSGVAVASRLWTFGDGTTNNGNNASILHVYSQGGYSVSLKVTDISGCKDSITKNNYINAYRPTASFYSNDTFVCTAGNVHFINTSTGAGLSYNWNFGDGTTSAQTSPNHIYNNPGNYTVRLIATDANNCKDTLIRVAYIHAGNLNLGFTMSDSFATCPPLTVNFANSSLGVSNFTWSFGTGNTSTLTSPSTTYTLPGVYTIKLKGYANGCVDSVTNTVTVLGPYGTFSYTPTSGCVPMTVQFSSVSTNTQSFIWDMNNGVTITTTTPALSYTYGLPGIFVPKVLLSDGNSCIVPILGTDTIKVGYLDADFSFSPTSVCQSGTINFNDTVLYSVSPISTRSWTFGDGGTSAAHNPSHFYASPGTYQVQLIITSALGCIDTITKNVIVKTSPVISAGNGQSLCQGQATSVQLQAIGAASYSWSPSATLSCSNCSNPQASPAATTTYSVIGTANNGCTDTAQVTVTVAAPPTVNAGPDQSMCNGAFAQLQASGAVTYSWTPTATLSCTSCSNPSANPLTTTTYTVTGTNASGCSNTDQVTITVSQLPTVSAGANQTMCIGSSAQLQATGATNFTWAPATGLSCTSCSNPVATPAVTTTYTVTGSGTASNSCSNTSTVTVTVASLPTVNAGSGQSTCVGSPVQLQATGAPNFSWSPATGLSCTNCSNPVATPTANTTYTVTGTNNNGCQDTDVVTVTVHQLPNINAGNDVSICPGGSTPLQATGAGTLSWSPATGLSCTSCSNPTASPAVTTTYTVTGTNSFGCSDSDQVTVMVNNLPAVNAGSDVAICPGSNTQLSASGAQTYSWSPAAGLSCTSCANPTASPASTTTYVATGTSANGCIDTDAVLVTVHPQAVVSGGTGQTICNGASVQLQPSGAISYVWNAAPTLSCTSCTNPVAAPTSTTTYTVTGTNGNGCSDTGTVTVTVNQLPAVNAGSNLSICTGSSAQLQATGAASYSWSPSAGLSCTNCANPVASPAATTTYTVTGTSNNSCTNTAQITVTVNPLPVVSAGNNVNICLGTSAQLQGTGATTYSWTPTAGLSCSNCASPTASPVTTTAYTVTGTDANGCSNTASVTVTIDTIPAVNAGANQVVCIGNTVQLQATGATSYSWSPAGTLSCTNCSNPVATTSATQTYSVVGTAANGCADTAQVLVTVAPLPVVNAGADQTICNGAYATLLATGAQNYSWAPAGTLSCSNCASPSANPTNNTTYTVTGTDVNGCTGTDQVDVIVSQLPTVSAGANQTICINGSAQLQATGATSFTWSPATGLSCTNCSNPVATPAVTTTYTVVGAGTATNTCSNTAQVTVTIAPPAVINGGPDLHICIGDSAQLQPSGGVSYVWDPAATLSCTNCANPWATPSVTTSYTLTGTDANGCVDTGIAKVIVHQLPNVNAGADTGICLGSSVQLQATGPANISWTPSSGLSCTNCSNPIANPINTTTYTVTGTTSFGCADTSQITVTVNYPPAVSAGNNVSVCPGSGAQLQATGAQTYSWSPAGGLSCTNCDNPIASPAITTIYTVTGTDIFGCTDTGVVTVDLYPLANVTGGPNQSICIGGSTQLQPTGGNTYIWDASPTLSCTNCISPTANPTTTTTYIVSSVNSNGCTDTGSVTITVNPLPVVNAGNDDTVCSGISTQLLASGAASYSWSPAATLSCTACANPNATPLTTTTYTVTGTNANGCANTDSVTIEVNALPVVNTGTGATICGGSTVQLQVTGAVSYSWSPATGLSCTNCSNPIATPTATTAYTVTGTDANGCIDTAVVSVGLFPPSNITGGPNQSICIGGSANLQATGGISYVWDPSPTLSCSTCANPVATPAATTTYTLMGTDANGCNDTGSVTVTVHPLPPVNAGNDVTICAGLSANLHATGGQSFMWSPATGLSCTNCASPVATPANTTTYTVTGTSNFGCVDTSTVTVTVNPLPAVNAGISDTICLGGAANLQATGASSYVWTPAATLTCSHCANPVATPAVTTTYTVTGTDSNGCVNISQVTVNLYTQPPVNAGADLTICRGQSSQLQASGAQSYIWSPASFLSCTSCPDPFTNTPDDISYSVIGTDTHGCSDSDKINITVIQSLPTSVGPGDTLCDGESTQLSASGGIEYLWLPATGLSDNQIANPVASPNTTTNYLVVIKQNQCFSDSSHVLVVVNPQPTVNAGPDQTMYAGTTITLAPEITFADRYEWTPASDLSCSNCPAPQASPQHTTTYLIKVANEFGCHAEDELTVNVTCDNSVIFFPNTFTPNGDGNNDFFYPQGKGIGKVVRFRIYDRWGGLVFNVVNIPPDDPLYGWDGYSKGQQLPPDVYVYIMDGLCENGTPLQVKGNIALIR